MDNKSSEQLKTVKKQKFKDITCAFLLKEKSDAQDENFN